MNPYIELDNISFGYKKTGFRIRGVSARLYNRETTIITGGNGSGKTTLSKLMIGILKADSGKTFVCGQDIKNMSLSAAAEKVGYLFQNPDRQLFCSTAMEEIMFSLRQKGVDERAAAETARALLARFSMAHKANEFPLKMSRGEKQRLALLAVFVMNPGFYILDEPSSGIDEENKDKLVGMLEEFKQQGAGLCIITHDNALISRLADRRITMADGRIVSDEKA
ncbi:MAG: energy-coupling factor ABC transporter ATP-binding protein [Christensenellales bacterium]|jgi:energy-coupling factor transport system ATP-binding protein